MGAIANMRPDLFRGIVADVAFVDLMNTMEDTSLPLTESEWNEWGNPIEDKDAYEYMLSYSPYDNVEAKGYPHLLFNSGISDEQVTYWEPTKMVARLRANKTDDNMLLLKMKMTAGHGGSSKRYESYRELAFDYAFCLKAAGLGSEKD
jgi:oligopeptidase B